jgi:hypothetical protein
VQKRSAKRSGCYGGDVSRGVEYSVSRGPSECRVALRISDGLLWIDIIGEPSGPDLVDCFRTALDSGWLKPSMRTVVDLTAFHGAVDWAAIDTIARMAPWGRGRPGAARVACVVRNAPFALLIKATWVRFPLVPYRIFFSRDAALAWVTAP